MTKDQMISQVARMHGRLLDAERAVVTEHGKRGDSDSPPRVGVLLEAVVAAYRTVARIRREVERDVRKAGAAGEEDKPRRPLSNESYVYYGGIRCPLCSCAPLTACGPIDVDGPDTYQTAECKRCGATWVGLAVRAVYDRFETKDGFAGGRNVAQAETGGVT